MGLYFCPMDDFDSVKHSPVGPPKYKLSGANVFVAPNGFHFIDHLDPVEELSPIIDGSALTDEEIIYIEKSLQSNPERIEHQVDSVKRHIHPAGRKVLDVGCGGGLFLSRMAQAGADPLGIELSDTRAYYAQTWHGLKIIKRPVEDPFWHEYEGAFEAATLWDVIEHVNFPLATIRSIASLLKSGGYLFIDTPCRDSFYHQFGELTYHLSRGTFPTFLNTMYSAQPFGHKQIFSLQEMRSAFEACGLEVVELKRFHELSFPYPFYLKKLVRSDRLVKLLLPFVRLFFIIFPIRNKMLAIGRKK